MENKNEPAFPVPADCYSREGMTKREYFACNAPNLIPDWFKHTPPEMDRTPMPLLPDTAPDEDVYVIRLWHDIGGSVPNHLNWYTDQFEKYQNEHSAFEYADRQARYFQWRVFYAEQLLTQLSNLQP